MYLLDSNLVLELLLEQERADEVDQLLREASSTPLYLSEFALHSIGIILFRLKRHQVFQEFVDDLVLGGRVRLVRVGAGDTILLELQALRQAVQALRRDSDEDLAAQLYGSWGQGTWEEIEPDIDWQRFSDE